jgi:chromosome segregation ATPase
MDEKKQMEEVINQLSANQKGLDSILETMGSFIEIYSSIEDNLKKFNIPDNYSFSKDLEIINKNLTKVNKTLGDSKNFVDEMNVNFQSIKDKIENFESRIKDIDEKYSKILEGQNNILNLIQSLDGLNEKIEGLKLINQQDKIRKYCDKVDTLEESISDSLVPCIINSNERMKLLERKLDDLLENKETKNKSIDTIAKEFVLINESLKTIAKTGSVDKAVLFSLFDEWQTERKKGKNKK